jgi:hypothetical protein
VKQTFLKVHERGLISRDIRSQSLALWGDRHMCRFTSQHNKSSSRGDVAAATWAVSHHSTTDPVAERPFSGPRDLIADLSRNSPLQTADLSRNYEI